MGTPPAAAAVGVGGSGGAGVGLGCSRVPGGCPVGDKDSGGGTPELPPPRGQEQTDPRAPQNQMGLWDAPLALSRVEKSSWDRSREGEKENLGEGLSPGQEVPGKGGKGLWNRWNGGSQLEK